MGVESTDFPVPSILQSFAGLDPPKTIEINALRKAQLCFDVAAQSLPSKEYFPGSKSH